MNLLYERQVAEDDLHLLLVEECAALLLRILRLLRNLRHSVQHAHIVSLRGHQLVEHLQTNRNLFTVLLPSVSNPDSRSPDQDPAF